MVLFCLQSNPMNYQYYITALLWLCMSVSINAQEFYINYEGTLLFHDVTDCNSRYVRNISRGSFVISADGLLLRVKTRGGAIVISQEDLNNTDLIVDNPLRIDLPEEISTVRFDRITSGNEEELFIASDSVILRVDLRDSSLHRLEAYDGVLGNSFAYLSGLLYSSVVVGGTYQYDKLVAIDAATGLVRDTLLADYDDGVRTILGLGSGFFDECHREGLYLGIQTVSPEFVLTHNDVFLHIENGMLMGVDTICIVSDSVLTENGRSDFTLFSLDQHSSNCTLQLDLDADNSQGRFGPHAQNVGLCRSLYELTDEDVSIQSPAAIDSLIIRLLDDGGQDYGQRILYEENAAFETVYELEGRLLKVFPVGNSAVSNDSWSDFISSTVLEVDGPRLKGWRTVGFEIYAAAGVSDMAKSFVHVYPNKFSAGPDTTLYLCRNFRFNTPEMFPNLTLGGSWMPELVTDNLGFEYFRSDTTPFGTYRYITDFENCDPDTSYITFAQFQPQIEAWPDVHDTVYVCEGESYFFDLYAIPGVSFGRFLDHPVWTLPVGEITPPITKLLWIEYEESPYGDSINLNRCDELVTFTVLESEEVTYVDIDTTICAGDSLYLGGFSFSQSGSYNFDNASGGCDTTYNLQLSTRQSVSITDERQLCPNHTVSAYGMSYSLPGDYHISLGDSPCDTQILLRLLPATSIVQSIDTMLCAGDSLTIGNTTFNQTGIFDINLPGEVCDTSLTLDLVIAPRFFWVIDTAIQSGDSLVVGDSVFREPVNFIFTLPGLEGDCDTVVKIDLELISNNRFVNRAGAEIIVQNPISSGQPFKVWRSSDNSRFNWSRLELFDVNGRLSLSIDKESPIALPTGVYLYRLYSEDRQDVYRGKLVVR